MVCFFLNLFLSSLSFTALASLFLLLPFLASLFLHLSVCCCSCCSFSFSKIFLTTREKKPPAEEKRKDVNIFSAAVLKNTSEHVFCVYLPCLPPSPSLHGVLDLNGLEGGEGRNPENVIQIPTYNASLLWFAMFLSPSLLPMPQSLFSKRAAMPPSSCPRTKARAALVGPSTCLPVSH